MSSAATADGAAPREPSIDGRPLEGGHEISVTQFDYWRVIDRWWTDDSDVKEFAEVCWGDRKVIMRRTNLDPVWRVHR